MTLNNTDRERIDALISAYGDGSNGAAPTCAQWEGIFEREAVKPITLLNFFKMRETAAYPENLGLSGSGQDAFDRYASVSIPTMQGAGGEFLLVGPYEGTFVGAEQDWDLIAVGSYPDVHALLRLYEDAAYQEAFAHRTAACVAQQVLIAAT